MNNKRVTTNIYRILDETPLIRTYFFKHDLCAEPGQFIMLTDFDGGEKPFSIADCNKEEFSVTIKKVGKFTDRLATFNAGDIVSFRGPFGSSFFISNKKVLLVGGGYGVPPFYFLARKLKENGAEVTMVNGARSESDLLYSTLFEKLGVRYLPCTQDGSVGYKGTSVDQVKDLLAKERFDFAYASGPELMVKALQPILGDMPYEFLFERYMKCAIGICGQCAMDPVGIRLCVEGPVLPREMVEQLDEFGQYHRESTGVRQNYK